MKGLDCSETLVKRLSSYTDTLNKIAPYEISISWTEVLLHTPYSKDNEEGVTRAKLVASWIEDYKTSHNADEDQVTIWEIDALMELVGQIMLTGIGFRHQ